jgi:hypothetical protein
MREIQENNFAVSEYNKMVLAQLDALNKNMSLLNQKISEIDQRVLAITLREDRIEDIISWKRDMSEVASINDIEKIKVKVESISIDNLKELKKEVKELRDFKIKAITVFSVVQAIMALVTFWQKF